MTPDKDQLKRHILDSDLTAMEKRYLEAIVDGTRWIPCSERMPAHYQHIIFAIADAKKPYNTFSGVYDALYNKFRSDVDWWVGENAVSHWMPLPEPPEEREEDEENE